MFCKYCGKNSGTSDICSECNEKINNFMQNCSVGENINNNQEYDWYKEQLETDKIAEEHIEYKGFCTFPRILGIVAAILFAICCIAPIYIYGDDGYLSLINIQKGEGFLIIPLFMLLNAIFDKSITTISLSGIHHGFLRFKLCILWGIIGLCAIIITPCMLSFYTGIVMQGYTGTFYIAVISCVLQIIAPFLVRENDGTGIKPVKKYDYIWIVLTILIAVVLCFLTVTQTRELVSDNNNTLEESLEESVIFDESGLIGCTYNGNDTVVVGIVMTNNTSQSFKFNDLFELKLFELGTEKSKVAIGSDFPVPDIYGKDMSSQTVESQYPAAIYKAFTVDDISNSFVIKVVQKDDESNVIFTVRDTPYITAYYENADEYYADEDEYYSEHEIQDLMNTFYSYAWVNATNNHDSSYVADYTVDGSPAYQMLGLEYWQERPTLRFDSIYDVNVINIEPKYDGSYDVYVYYTYELYYTDKDKTNSNIELAIDNVVWNGYEFLVNNHTWVNDIPVGSSVSISDFDK